MLVKFRMKNCSNSTVSRAKAEKDEVQGPDQYQGTGGPNHLPKMTWDATVGQIGKKPPGSQQI